jgi:hypothetical protein
MKRKQLAPVCKEFETLWHEGTFVGVTDGPLLERFVDRRQVTLDAGQGGGIPDWRQAIRPQFRTPGPQGRRGNRPRLGSKAA